MSNKNAGYLNQGFYKNNSHILALYDEIATNSYSSVSGSIILDLVVGDYVYVKNEGGKPLNSAMVFNSFCGYLIG